MNERIKELMSQAGFDPAAIERMGVMPQAEKFAELIVKECIDCAIWVGQINKIPVEPIHTTHAVKLRIQKHFGAK